MFAFDRCNSLNFRLDIPVYPLIDIRASTPPNQFEFFSMATRMHKFVYASMY